MIILKQMKKFSKIHLKKFEVVNFFFRYSTQSWGTLYSISLNIIKQFFYKNIFFDYYDFSQLL
jgi:hypothetical protein